MKKSLLILTALLLMGTGTLSAQKYEKNILGVRAGLNLSNLSASSEGVTFSTNSRAAFHVAVTDQILLSQRLPFYLETGLAFSSRGGKVKSLAMRPSYLQIPVLINYHINIRNIVSIQPFAGLYYGFGIGGKAKAKGDLSDLTGEEGNVKVDLFGDNGFMKRSDLGVRLGAGVAWKHLYFGLGYEIGCLNLIQSDLVDGSDVKMHNNCFTISVGYNF